MTMKTEFVDADAHVVEATLAPECVKRWPDAFTFGSTDEIVSFLGGELRSGDQVVIMSNGGFDNIHNKLLERLRKGQA